MRYVALVLVLALLAASVPFAVASKSHGHGLPYDRKTKHYVFQAVVQMPNVSADELYGRAKQWVATSYKSASAVTVVDDRTGGRLVVKGFSAVLYGESAALFEHTITVETKPGRYRYTMSDLILLSKGEQGEPTRTPAEEVGLGGEWEDSADQVLDGLGTTCAAMVAALKAAMSKPSPAGDKSW